MASAVIEMDWPREGHPVRELFPEWVPRDHWIRRQDDSNLGCQVWCCRWRATNGA
jgi:hypothetical protein